jgi:hypothetical protein
MRAALARFRAKRTGSREENASDWDQTRQRPQRGGRYPFVRQLNRKSAAVVSGCNARNVRTIEADIGQFAIAELGQFADIALIIPESLDHADERE